MENTEFMLKLAKSLKEKRNIADSTCDAYIRALRVLNGKKPFKSLAFLNKMEAITQLINEYAPSTQLSLYATLVAVLFLCKDKMPKAYEYYLSKMTEKKSDASKVDTTQKTEKQEKNWITMEEVKKVKDDLGQKVKDLAGKKTLTNAQYTILLHYTVLSLYTDIPPRRNQDYLLMKTLRLKKGESVPELDKDSNWLIVENKVPKKMVFNKYKTSKKYGESTLDVPSDLASVLAMYLRHSPSKEKVSHFLLAYDGTPLTAVNAITRILNRVFGKKVGASMLRHIYLSDKYGDVLKEMKEDADAMAHSTSQQKDYVKYDDAASVELPTILKG